MASYKIKIILISSLSFYPWDKNVPLSHSMLIWRVSHNKMPTDENMNVRGFNGPSMCSLCRDNSETTSLIFFQCKYVINIWIWLMQKLQFTGNINCLQDCLTLIKPSWSPQAKDVALSCICSVIHQI